MSISWAGIEFPDSSLVVKLARSWKMESRGWFEDEGSRGRVKSMAFT